MAKRSLRLVLTVFAALGVACGADRVVEPNSAVLTRIELTPPDPSLIMGAPYNTVQLVLKAYDQNGATMPAYGDATYSSSAPRVATVSGSGVVTAVAPGRAEITAIVTFRGSTRTTSVAVTVGPIDHWDIYGEHDLTAPITGFDPAWGDLSGYRYTAVLTLGTMWDPPWLIEGSYADLRIIGPGGDTLVVADTGSVRSYFDPRGEFIIELVGNQSRIGLFLVVASLAPELMDGRFGCCGHISGTFTATRRR